MILEALLKAVERDESLRVRYFGGSSPGSERELMPISIKDGKVRARCLSSGETKTFLIEKMELVIDGVPSALAASFPAPEPVYASVEEFLNHQTAALQEWMGASTFMYFCLAFAFCSAWDMTGS